MAVIDYSGNGNDGTLLNGATLVADGPNANIQGSVQLDGTNQCIEIQNASALNPTNKITIRAWVYWEGGNNSYPFILAKGKHDQYDLFGGESGNFSPWLRINPSNNVSRDFHRSSVQILNSNQWYYIAASIDAINGQSNLYIWDVSGVLVDSHYETTPSYAIETTTENVYIGSGRLKSYSFKGKITDVLLENVARTQTEIANDRDLRKNGSDSNVIGYWKLNEAAPVSETDSAGVVARNTEAIIGAGVATAGGAPAITAGASNSITPSESAAATDQAAIAQGVAAVSTANGVIVGQLSPAICQSIALPISSDSVASAEINEPMPVASATSQTSMTVGIGGVDGSLYQSTATGMTINGMGIVSLDAAIAGAQSTSSASLDLAQSTQSAIPTGSFNDSLNADALAATYGGSSLASAFAFTLTPDEFKQTNVGAQPTAVSAMIGAGQGFGIGSGNAYVYSVGTGAQTAAGVGVYGESPEIGRGSAEPIITAIFNQTIVEAQLVEGIVGTLSAGVDTRAIIGASETPIIVRVLDESNGLNRAIYAPLGPPSVSPAFDGKLEVCLSAADRA